MNDISTPAFAGVSTPSATAASSLDHLALLAVRGADARSFLDSQLTRNVPPPGAGSDAWSSASLAGYCSPKGRLIASFTVWTEADTIWLIVSRDIAEAVAKRLRMYVLRAKVTIEDATATTRLDGFTAPGRLPGALDTLPVWGATTIDGDAWLRVPDAESQARYLRVGPRRATAPDGAVAADRWRWLDVRAGLPRITAATQDRFVPQMLNLEALGGVDFKKGCFPGQEIVARSQYLGKLKRRMALASIASADVPSPGTDVWVGDPEACGLVVNAEAGPDGRTSLLVELPVALFASTALRLATADGPTLTVEPLPYDLPDNEVFVRPKL